MGDYFGHLVDQKARASEASVLADRMSAYLIARGVIASDLTDCVLDERHGHAPGPNYQDAIDSDESCFLDLTTNGVLFETKRTVFHSGQGDLSVRCGTCDRIDELEETLSAWQDAVGRWYEGDDNASLTCPSCSKSTRIVDWAHDPPWGFGSFAITFWNWPRLKPSFIDELQTHLGHPLRMVSGKL